MSGSSEYSLGTSDLIVQRLLLDFFNSSLKCFEQLQKSDIEALTWDNQKKFLDSTVNSEILTKYPVNSKFSRLFLKKLIELLETVQEVHDDLYSFLCTTMKIEDKETLCYRHYIIGGDMSNIITIRETNNLVVNGTTGMRTWEAARMLGDWVLSNKDIVNSKKVLELGCGVGFTGITIAKQCNVDSVVMTDCNHDVLKTVCKNIEINFPNVKKLTENNTFSFKTDEISVGVMKLDWDDDDYPTSVVPDILIGADIVYDPSIIKSLCKTMKKVCEINRDLKIIIANVLRNEDTINYFLKTLGCMSFTWERIIHSGSRYIEWDQSMKICLLSITYNTSGEMK